jgi:hypothetical protein
VLVLLYQGEGDGSTCLHLAVDEIATANFTSGTAVIAPASTPLPVGTIARHVASVAAHAADNASSVILSLGTVILAVANLPAVLAGLVLIISESTVERGKLSKLVSLEFVLSFGDGCSL